MSSKSTLEKPIHVPTIHYAQTPEFIRELGLVTDKLLNPAGKTPEELRKTVQKQHMHRQEINALVAQSKIDPREVAGKTLNPREYGAKLINAAMRDAQNIFGLSLGAFSGRHDPFTRAKILKDSSVDLLRMAGLKGGDKNVILDTRACSKDRSPVELLVREDNTESLAWIKPISDMIDERHEEYRKHNLQKVVGCPAIQAFVELPTGRESIIHNFWNRYVEVMLEQPSPSIEGSLALQAVEL